MKQQYILGADMGTSSVKAGIFDLDGNLVQSARSAHNYIANGKFVDIDPEECYKSLLNVLKELKDYLPKVVAMGFSVLCPNMIFMDKEGKPLAHGIIHLDRRSEPQGKRIAEVIGMDKFTSVSGNVPCPGGMSVTSLLWTMENRPEIYKKAHKLGHTNTFLLKRLTGEWAIDPSNASFNGLYDTFAYKKEWRRDFCEALGVDMDKLPAIRWSWETAGRVSPEAAAATGLPAGIPVVTGGGDTACAVYGSGCTEDGQMLNSTGTVEVMALCVKTPFYDPKFVFRTAVIPNRWVSMNIIGAGGESLNWFYRVFCKDMTKEEFFNKYLPDVLGQTETHLESFTPHLAGDRTCVADKQAVLSGLTLASSRETILKSVVDGMIAQLQAGMDTFKEKSDLSDLIYYTGGGSKSLMDYKCRHFPKFRFEEVNECALKGIVKLILDNVKERHKGI